MIYEKQFKDDYIEKLMVNSVCEMEKTGEFIR